MIPEQVLFDSDILVDFKEKCVYINNIPSAAQPQKQEWTILIGLIERNHSIYPNCEIVHDIWGDIDQQDIPVMYDLIKSKVSRLNDRVFPRPVIVCLEAGYQIKGSVLIQKIGLRQAQPIAEDTPPPQEQVLAFTETVQPLYNPKKVADDVPPVSQKAQNNTKKPDTSKLLMLVLFVVILIASAFLRLSNSQKSADPPEQLQAVSQIVVTPSTNSANSTTAVVPSKTPVQEDVLRFTEPTNVPEPDAPSQKAPSREDILPFGDVITYPSASSYLDHYEIRYVKAPKGHSIYVFWNYNGGVSDSKRRFLLYEGDKVTVLARQGTRSCVIFTTSSGEQQVGWVNSDYLVPEY